MIGSSPELGPIMAGNLSLKRSKVGKRFLHLAICVILQVCFLFRRVSVRVLGKDISLAKNLNMNGEFIDVVGNTV